MHISNTPNPIVAIFSQAIQQTQGAGPASEVGETTGKESSESRQTQVKEGERAQKTGRLDIFA